MATIRARRVDELGGRLPAAIRLARLGDGARGVAAGRCDFHMGAKLRGFLERSGFAVLRELALEDRELSFEGPARAEVLEAWSRRFERMKLLQEFCGPDFARVRADFLGCLAREDQRSTAKVRFCFATRSAD